MSETVSTETHIWQRRRETRCEFKHQPLTIAAAPFQIDLILWLLYFGKASGCPGVVPYGGQTDSVLEGICNPPPQFSFTLLTATYAIQPQGLCHSSLAEMPARAPSSLIILKGSGPEQMATSVTVDFISCQAASYLARYCSYLAISNEKSSKWGCTCKYHSSFKHHSCRLIGHGPIRQAE